ncbi:LOW QUALITY PROTEIN: NPC1-like intracellular cholesterol transporter 1 [Rhincodon typus]|uniref:LOW QUALITY PROTEIN: NPC1-like intracellular cholesterol transporter 1 n=1 Tax=Rhincodon typus TaxID=259920 RepID=UPI0020302161|nr:LOW QUALITY PROTEIN: NPC1-like intracellular cholesterol transporter 1 [Rhincodon typus]
MLPEVFVVQSLLNLVSVGATYTPIHRDGYCAFYEDCGKNPEVTGSLLPARVPCLYNGPAKRVTSSMHLQLLQQVCPMLAGLGGETRACCSHRQLKMLEKSLVMSKPLLSRCPSCVDNFVNLYCQNTCSPNQSVHINVTRAFRANISGSLVDAVLEYQCYYSSRFAKGSYNSCRNVRIPSTGGYAISPMCGKYGATLCNAERWLRFQGDSSNGLAPLDIQFVLVPPTDNGSAPGPGPGGGIVPYDGVFHRCDQPSGPEGQACSCLDCVESCPALPTPPAPPGPWTIGRMDGPLALGLILFVGAVLLFACLLFLCRQCPDDHEKNKAPKVTCTRPSTQQRLSWVFQSWGTAVARHPVPVLLASCVAVAVLSCGLVFVKLTTDPVELWSAPESQARSEKAFHDAQFGPFFRTNQIIVTVGPDGHPGYTYNSVFFGPTAFSGLFSKELLLQLLDLQTRLQSISVWSETARRNITLKDICYAPLNPDSPRPTDCAVNSLLQYFQNNRSLIDAVANQTMAGVTGTVDWRDHFLYCINSPLSFKDSTELGMSCIADYGAPVFPFLAVGGYQGEDFSKAEAFIITFSLNNYQPDDPRHEFVLLWEREYLKILQDYKNNKSIKFSFVYMSERSLEDEINRTTAEDIPIFAISYLVIFIYIALALGEYTSWRTVMIDSKVTLGLGGILVVLGAVFASMGTYAYAGVPSSLIILEVVPFLVLAVGADNLFILVLQYGQRDGRSYMAIAASSWVDDFIDWLNPMSRCCRLFASGPNVGEFCPATNNQFACRKKCMKSGQSGIIRPDVEQFNMYLPRFLNDTPTLQCSKGGLGAYGNAVKRDPNGTILASRFMAYHTPLKNSQEYTAALKVAREIAANITKSTREVPGTDPNFEVFPYTITYVYYEQYLTIVNEGLFNIGLCLIPTFVVCCILLGMDIHSGFLNLITIMMIIVDTVGVMTLWDIQYNAVSLINLVTAVGISVEFVSHLTRSFAVSTKKNKVERAKEATYTMGSAVFAGVAMTNLPGIIVLYFAQSQLIQVFFFRLNLVITLLGLVHGLVFLPVLLSYFGPGINTAALLQQDTMKEPLPDNTYVDRCFHNFGYKGSVEDKIAHSTTQCNGSAKMEKHTVPGDRETLSEKGSDLAGSCTDTNSTVTSF